MVYDIMIEKASNGFVVIVHGDYYEKTVFLDFASMMVWLAHYYESPPERKNNGAVAENE